MRRKEEYVTDSLCLLVCKVTPNIVDKFDDFMEMLKIAQGTDI